MQITTKTHMYYENVETTVANGASLSQLSTLGTTFQSKFNKDAADQDYATSVVIRTNQTISVRLNKSTNDAVTITSADSPYEIAGIKIVDMFFSNSSGSDATVRLFFSASKY